MLCLSHPQPTIAGKLWLCQRAQSAVDVWALQNLSRVGHNVYLLVLKGCACVQGWLKNPPAPKAAPRIPSGLAAQHADINLPGPDPVATQHSLPADTTASIAAPFVNPDAMLSQPAPIQNAAAAREGSHVPQPLRTAEAPTTGARDLGGAAAQEFQGDVMTFNEAKGWERVAGVRSRGWPPGVPIPQYAILL